MFSQIETTATTDDKIAEEWLYRFNEKLRG
jgi:hypothetical protein